MPRLDTKLEAQGAEFLVLGTLLAEGIVAYKTYTNMPGYDLIASNPEGGTSCRIQVKSRWATDYDGAFPIKSLESDFVVVVALNRGYRYSKPRGATDSGRRAPTFYVLPTRVLRRLPRGGTWKKVFLKDVARVGKYIEAWDLIRKALRPRR